MVECDMTPTKECNRIIRSSYALSTEAERKRLNLRYFLMENRDFQYIKNLATVTQDRDQVLRKYLSSFTEFHKHLNTNIIIRSVDMLTGTHKFLTEDVLELIPVVIRKQGLKIPKNRYENLRKIWEATPRRGLTLTQFQQILEKWGVNKALITVTFDIAFHLTRKSSIYYPHQPIRTFSSDGTVLIDPQQAQLHIFKILTYPINNPLRTCENHENCDQTNLSNAVSLMELYGNLDKMDYTPLKMLQKSMKLLQKGCVPTLKPFDPSRKPFEKIPLSQYVNNCKEFDLPHYSNLFKAAFGQNAKKITVWMAESLILMAWIEKVLPEMNVTKKNLLEALLILFQDVCEMNFLGKFLLPILDASRKYVRSYEIPVNPSPHRNALFNLFSLSTKFSKTKNLDKKKAAQSLMRKSHGKIVGIPRKMRKIAENRILEPLTPAGSNENLEGLRRIYYDLRRRSSDSKITEKSSNRRKSQLELLLKKHPKIFFTATESELRDIFVGSYFLQEAHFHKQILDVFKRFKTQETPEKPPTPSPTPRTSCTATQTDFKSKTHKEVEHCKKCSRSAAHSAAAQEELKLTQNLVKKYETKAKRTIEVEKLMKEMKSGMDRQAKKFEKYVEEKENEIRKMEKAHRQEVKEKEKEIEKLEGSLSEATNPANIISKSSHLKQLVALSTAHKTEISGLKEQLKSVQEAFGTVVGVEAEIEAEKLRNSKLENEISRLKMAQKDRESENTATEQITAELFNRISDLESTILAKDLESQGVKEMNEIMTKRFANLEEQVKTLTEELKLKEAKELMAGKEKEMVGGLQLQNQKQDATIKDLNQKLTELRMSSMASDDEVKILREELKLKETKEKGLVDGLQRQNLEQKTEINELTQKLAGLSTLESSRSSSQPLSHFLSSMAYLPGSTGSQLSSGSSSSPSGSSDCLESSRSSQKFSMAAYFKEQVKIPKEERMEKTEKGRRVDGPRTSQPLSQLLSSLAYLPNSTDSQSSSQDADESSNSLEISRIFHSLTFTIPQVSNPVQPEPGLLSSSKNCSICFYEMSPAEESIGCKKCETMVHEKCGQRWVTKGLSCTICGDKM